ncbi:hypothetical protein HNQ92_005733 [Rhabdobacter roseus]|uniref:Uncharacterized protein n=1 Tax=Rhabdobacter roseus TaxID=1655419 RepID=A0A840U6X2_9BACT|nr:hypothetical protein [Rhabdobacter roseus]MBB5287569.1 hypothetical protein [Rhabdobacter roseus]
MKPQPQTTPQPQAANRWLLLLALWGSLFCFSPALPAVSCLQPAAPQTELVARLARLQKGPIRFRRASSQVPTLGPDRSAAALRRLVRVHDQAAQVAFLQSAPLPISFVGGWVPPKTIPQSSAEPLGSFLAAKSFA